VGVREDLDLLARETEGRRTADLLGATDVAQGERRCGEG